MRYLTLLRRGLALRCPVCGRGKLFSGWLAMHKRCPECDAPFAREPGFFLGAIYVNYGLTALIVAIVYPVLLFRRAASNDVLLACAMGFVILFPLLIHRHARSLWLTLDQFYDPRPGETGTGRDADG